MGGPERRTCERIRSRHLRHNLAVEVTGTYHPRFLGLIGITRLPLTGSATTRLGHSLGGGRTMTSLKARMAGLATCLAIVFLIVGTPLILIATEAIPTPSDFSWSRLTAPTMARSV